jgi:hypothetical protein
MERGEARNDCKIYVVISQTGTILSRFLKLVTRAPYNHVSLSLSRDLQTMYSFGRINPYNPFLGGFVRESPSFGTFKRFSNTTVMVLEISVSLEVYERIRRRLNEMLAEQKKYHYNYIGLGLAAFHIRWQQKYHYYCSEFVKDILSSCCVSGAESLHRIPQPIHFLNLSYTCVYTGRLRDYCPPPIADAAED